MLYCIKSRFWIGTWIAIICIILVAIDASALVCYITRFTEENFACLIGVIYIYKVNLFKCNSRVSYDQLFSLQAIENIFDIGKTYPINPPEVYDCVCLPPNNVTEHFVEFAKYNKKQCGVRHTFSSSHKPTKI